MLMRTSIHSSNIHFPHTPFEQYVPRKKCVPFHIEHVLHIIRIFVVINSPICTFSCGKKNLFIILHHKPAASFVSILTQSRSLSQFWVYAFLCTREPYYVMYCDDDNTKDLPNSTTCELCVGFIQMLLWEWYYL